MTGRQRAGLRGKGEEGFEAMMFYPGGPAPPGRHEYERASGGTAPNRASWFGARLRVTSERCRLADELFRLAWRAGYRASGVKDKGGEKDRSGGNNNA